MTTWRIIPGDALTELKKLPDGGAHCIVTSPPYWSLRDYGIAGQLGLEKTIEEYLEKMVAVFREARRVLRGDGTAWVNMGDCYYGSGGAGGDYNEGGLKEGQPKFPGAKCRANRALNPDSKQATNLANAYVAHDWGTELKPKDLCGMPWRLAFALQADGWWLRSDIVWHKPNPMPESVTDRPTKSHEYVFLLSKSQHYYYDADAVKEEAVYERRGWFRGAKYLNQHSFQNDASAGRNLHDVWTIPTQPFSEAHFATFPEKLVEPCVKAGTSEKGCCPKCGTPWERIVERQGGQPSTVAERKALGIYRPPSTFGAPIDEDGKSLTGKNRARPPSGQQANHKSIGWQPACGCGGAPVPCTVLDIFSGAGTTGVVALKAGRNYIGIELNPEYIEIARRRIGRECGLITKEKP